MMATKPKPSESSTSTIPTSTSTSTSNTTTTTMESIVVLPKSELTAAVTTEEREDALHQRLAALGATSDETTTTATTTTKPVVPNKNDKSALLARIMAAQERAKQAQQQQQQQQQQQKKAPEPAPEPEPEPEPVVKEENHRKMAKQKMLDALSVKPTTLAQPVFAPTTTELKPPSFDAVEHTLLPPTNAPIVPPMHNTAPLVPPPPPPMMAPPMHTAPPPPPMMMAPRMAEPSAPVLEAPKLDTSHHLQDVVPMAMAPPPSFADYEQQRNTTNTTDNLTNWMQKISTASDTTNTTTTTANNDVMQLDLEGNPMSAEERAKMMEEQRAIMEQIQKEKQANDAAIAAAKAENFEQRTAPGAAASNANSSSMVVNSNTVVEESQPLVPMEDVPAVTSRTVDIGGGQRVALQGQERTKAAIASGTALLVQCCNCQSWMQVTPTATLMYCPVCATVSPVIVQTDVATKDEAMQMMRDRQLAEQLQNEEYESRSTQRPNNTNNNTNTAEETKDGAGVSSWFSSLTGGGAATAAPATRTDFQSTFTQQQQEQKKAASWYDSFTSVFGSSTESTAAAAARSAEVKVTRPPGGGLQEVRTGQETQHSDYFPESERLIGSHNANANNQLQPARVAEKPSNPFSCVVDTVNSFGTTLTTGGTATRPNGNVHGINASPLLAVPNIGRNNNNNTNNSSAGGDYQRVPHGP